MVATAVGSCKVAAGLASTQSNIDLARSEQQQPAKQGVFTCVSCVGRFGKLLVTLLHVVRRLGGSELTLLDSVGVPALQPRWLSVRHKDGSMTIKRYVLLLCIRLAERLLSAGLHNLHVSTLPCLPVLEAVCMRPLCLSQSTLFGCCWNDALTW